MNEFPETSHSLLLRVKNPDNREAWEQFVKIYRPVIFRTALARGLQHADAHDLAQQVLMSVAGAIGRWEQQSQSTKFRHWLRRVTKNAILNALTRQPKDRASGDSAIGDLLQDVKEQDPATTALIDNEYRRELYKQAAKAVEANVQATTWEAFDLTVVQGIDIETAAARLGKTTGAIYTARSRVMLRLRDVIAQLEKDS